MASSSGASSSGASSSSSSSSSSSPSTSKALPEIQKTDLVLSSGRGLKEIAKERLLSMVRSIEPAHGAKSFKVMVIDGPSLGVINSICTMYDIMQENVSLVEDINKRREPLPKMEALYLMAPIEESITKAINDFRKDVDERRTIKVYRAAHFVFLSELSDDLLRLIGESAIAPHLRTLKELNLDFLVNESQVFQTPMPNALPTLFGSGLEDRQLSISFRRHIETMIGTLCVTLGERPYIRSSSSDLARDFAEGLEDRIAALHQSIASYPPPRALENRATLLVLDRRVDPLSPLLHEFTYAAMAYDLLNIDPTTNTYEREYVDSTDTPRTERSLLDESDPIWVQFRHGHISKVATLLSRQFQEFLAANKGAMELTKSGMAVTSFSKGSHGLRELRDAFNKVPQYRDLRSKYSLHMNLAGSCLDEMESRNLVKIATFQQQLVMGDKVKNPLEELKTLLSGRIRSIEDRIRTIAIFIISQKGMKESTRREIYDLFELSAEHRTFIENMARLGVDYSKAYVQQEKKYKKGQKPLNVSRYRPNLEKIIEDIFSDELSQDEYPYAGDAPPVSASSSSGGGARSRWVNNKVKREQAQKKHADRDTESISPFFGPRLIIFVLGGITHSEIRTIYEMTAKTHHEIFIGSTHILTPKQFLSEVIQIK